MTVVSRLPGVRDHHEAVYRQVFASDNFPKLPRGKTIDGSKSRDPLSSDVWVLGAGTLMGEITASGKYAPAVIGTVDTAVAGADTTASLSVADGVELNRRVGASGTFKLTGPPTAAGTVRTSTITYSAINTSNGTVTITAPATDAVWTLTPVDGTDGGTFKLKVTLPDGSAENSADITFNATGATFASNIDTALEAVSILPDDAVSVSAVDTTGVATITFDGTDGAVQLELIDDRLTDGGVYEGAPSLVETTAGVDGRFVSGSLVQPTDGSETIVSMIPDGFGIRVVDEDLASIDVPYPVVPIGGVLDSSQIRNWPSDASLQQWIEDALNATGEFVFDHNY